jgi:Uma2 family endonuclease
MTQPMIDTTHRKQAQTQPTSRRDVGKSEFLDGGIVAKPAANRWHNLIATNFVAAIGSRVHRGSCEVYAGDMQVQVGRNSICYPDVVVVSGEPTFNDDSGEVLQNPTVLIDIYSSVSKSARQAQRVEAFLAVPKIREVLLVNESELRIEHYTSQNAKTWTYRIYDERDDVINLESINCKLSLSEVYSQVQMRGQVLRAAS